MIKDLLIYIFNFYDKIIFGTEYTYIQDLGYVPKDTLDFLLNMASILLTVLTPFIIVFLIIYIYTEFDNFSRKFRRK